MIVQFREHCFIALRYYQILPRKNWHFCRTIQCSVFNHVLLEQTKMGEVIPRIRLRMYQDGNSSSWRHLRYNSRISKKGTAKLLNRTIYIHEKCRTTRTAFRCYTGRFATTIFNAKHHFNIVATLFRMAAMFQHCYAVLRKKL